jgi:uncharacterized membrane protein
MMLLPVQRTAQLSIDIQDVQFSVASIPTAGLQITVHSSQDQDYQRQKESKRLPFTAPPYNGLEG